VIERSGLRAIPGSASARGVTARELLLALAAALVTAAIACAEIDDPRPFTVESGGRDCVPGSQHQCACPNGLAGIQVCLQDGKSFAACTCGSGGQGGSSSGSCTLFPDCVGCADCFETCICQSSGDVLGCKAQCVDAGGAAGSSGECFPQNCDPPPFNAGQGCCTSKGTCGYEVNIIGPGCQERDQPGSEDVSCPDVMFGQLNLQGCCRPDEKCGLLDTFVGLGCVDPLLLNQPAGPSCTP
jgi:hypothetical protein